MLNGFKRYPPTTRTELFLHLIALNTNFQAMWQKYTQKETISFETPINLKKKRTDVLINKFNWIHFSFQYN